MTMKIFIFAAILGVGFAAKCTGFDLLTTAYQTKNIVQAYPLSKYFKAQLCQKEYVGKLNVRISVIMPNNPNWCDTKGKVYLEVSNCTNANFDKDPTTKAPCVISTNYKLIDSANGKRPDPFSVLVYEFDRPNLGIGDIIYIRVWDYMLGSAEAEILVEFVPKSIGTTKYEVVRRDWWPDIVNPEVNKLQQFTKSNDHGDLINFDSHCYEFAFCEDPNDSTVKTVDVAVVSTFGLSAFVTYSCLHSFGLNNCYPNGPGALTCKKCFDGDVNPFNFLSISAPERTIYNGFLYIEGYGGNPENTTCPEQRGINRYSVNVKLSD